MDAIINCRITLISTHIGHNNRPIMHPPPPPPALSVSLFQFINFPAVIVQYLKFNSI